jgi:ankyrin repeat protein
MKSKLLSAFLISLSFASADDGKPVNEALRDALYAEEVTRDNEAAAKQYEEVVSRYQAHREFAATALFRLAEVRRKQDRKEDAIKLYQQLITEFPSSEKQAALAKENLTELGGTIPSGATAPAVPESRNLERIRRLEKESPDQLDALKEFTDAIEGGYPGIIRHFIAKGVDPNATLPVNRYTNGGNRNTALAIAAADGSLSICELLLESGAKAGGKGFSNPLPDAVYYGRTAIVELFLKHGADPDDLTLAVEDPIAPFVGGALAIAIERGHLKIAELLIDRGANVNLVHPKTGLAPLHFALAAGHIDIAKKLLEKGADPDVECLQFQPRKNVPPSVGPRNPILPIGETPLLLAVSAGSIPLMETILPKSRKADLGKLLRRAAERNVPAMVKWLLEKGADPSPLSGENTQMIYRAVRSGNLETVKALLAAGANPSASMIGMDFDTDDLEKVLAGLPPQRTYTAMELTPLRAAVVLPEHALEMTKLLIDAGATPDDRWLKSLAGKPTEGTPPDPSKIPPAVGNLLAERFVIPKLNQEQTIHLLFTAPLLSKPVALTVEKSGTLPPGLPQLLLNSESIQWPAFTFSPHSAANFPERVEVWRTRAGSASIAWQGKLDQKGDFPVLFWGDVIRVGFDEGIAGHVTRHAADVSYQNQLPP